MSRFTQQYIDAELYYLKPVISNLGQFRFVTIFLQYLICRSTLYLGRDGTTRAACALVGGLVGCVDSANVLHGIAAFVLGKCVEHTHGCSYPCLCELAVASGDCVCACVASALSTSRKQPLFVQSKWGLAASQLGPIGLNLKDEAIFTAVGS